MHWSVIRASKGVILSTELSSPGHNFSYRFHYINLKQAADRRFERITWQASCLYVGGSFHQAGFSDMPQRPDADAHKKIPGLCGYITRGSKMPSRRVYPPRDKEATPHWKGRYYSMSNSARCQPSLLDAPGESFYDVPKNPRQPFPPYSQTPKKKHSVFSPCKLRSIQNGSCGACTSKPKLSTVCFDNRPPLVIHPAGGRFVPGPCAT